MFILPALLLIGLGIFSIKSKTPASFYSFTKVKIDMSKIKEYNRETGLLLIAYGLAIALFEIPVRFWSEDIAVVMIIIAMPFLLVAGICIYEFKILKKYKI